jgi:hypothetical protein
MTKKKTTAPAEQLPVAEAPEGPITGARLIRIPRGDQRFPAAIYKGEAPAKGSEIVLKMDNGTSYSGIVHDATDADGEVLVEFRDGLTPVA